MNVNVNIEIRDVSQNNLLDKHLIFNITDISNNKLVHCIRIDILGSLLDQLKNSFSDPQEIILVNDKYKDYETKSKKYLSLTDNILVFKIIRRLNQSQ